MKDRKQAQSAIYRTFRELCTDKIISIKEADNRHGDIVAFNMEETSSLNISFLYSQCVYTQT